MKTKGRSERAGLCLLCLRAYVDLPTKRMDPRHVFLNQPGILPDPAAAQKKRDCLVVGTRPCTRPWSDTDVNLARVRHRRESCKG
jgi:hypothetical protein